MANPRDNPEAEKLWCRWSATYGTWTVCNAVDRGAVLFHRAQVNVRTGEHSAPDVIRHT